MKRRIKHLGATVFRQVAHAEAAYIPANLFLSEAGEVLFEFRRRQGWILPWKQGARRHGYGTNSAIVRLIERKATAARQADQLVGVCMQTGNGSSR